MIAWKLVLIVTMSNGGMELIQPETIYESKSLCTDSIHRNMDVIYGLSQNPDNEKVTPNCLETRIS